MSFDLFVQCFRHGKVTKFKRTLVEEIFGPYAIGRSAKGGIERLFYPEDDGGGELYGDDGEEIGSLMFSHFGGDALYDGIYALTDRIKGVIYWADEAPCSAITDPEVLAHLPPELVDGVGPPAVVHDRQGIYDAIKQNDE